MRFHYNGSMKKLDLCADVKCEPISFPRKTCTMSHCRFPWLHSICWSSAMLQCILNQVFLAKMNWEDFLEKWSSTFGTRLLTMRIWCCFEHFFMCCRLASKSHYFMQKLGCKWFSLYRNEYVSSFSRCYSIDLTIQNWCGGATSPKENGCTHMKVDASHLVSYCMIQKYETSTEVAKYWRLDRKHMLCIRCLLSFVAEKWTICHRSRHSYVLQAEFFFANVFPFGPKFISQPHKPILKADGKWHDRKVKGQTKTNLFNSFRMGKIFELSINTIA